VVAGAGFEPATSGL